jgi:competence protein ComGC
VVFAVSNFNNEGKASACKSDVKTIETAEEAYYAQQGHQYASLDDLLGKNYIKEKPGTTNGYTISVDSTTGAVTSAPACNTLG